MRRAFLALLMVGTAGGCALNPQPEDPHSGVLSNQTPTGTGATATTGAAGASAAGAGIALVGGGTDQGGTGNSSTSTGATTSTGAKTSTGATTGMGASTGSGGTGNQASGTGNAGSATAGAAAGLACGAKAVLPMPKDGWISAESNPWAIQGAWSWGADQLGTTVSNTVPNMPPTNGSGAMCLVGTTSTEPAAWGAWLGFDLNSTSGATPVRSEYSFPAHSLTRLGFRVTGNLGGHALRVVMANSEVWGNDSPYLELSGEGCHSVVVSDALQAPGVTQPRAMDAARVRQVQFQLVGAKSGTFDFCIEAVTFD